MARQKAIKPTRIGCLCCGSAEPTLPLRTRIAVGFGEASLRCDDEVVWCERPGMTERQLWTVAKAEKIAEKKPKCDWRIILHGPLRSRTYQRHGKEKWCLIEEGDGFA